MKCFEIVKNPKISIAPRLKNWYGCINVRDIRIDTFYKLPKQQTFTVEMTKREMFTDFILFPFVLISPMVKDLIQIYDDICLFTQVTLLDSGSGRSMIYYLPVFEETDRLEIHTKEFEYGQCVKMPAEEKKPVFINKNIFWVKDSLTRHTIISLDFAEIILQNRVTGVELKEVILCEKEGEE